jgi:hypothetical protein
MAYSDYWSEYKKKVSFVLKTIFVILYNIDYTNFNIFLLYKISLSNTHCLTFSSFYLNLLSIPICLSYLFWDAAVWFILSSLMILFFSMSMNVEQLVERNKSSSWNWFLDKTTGYCCNFYEWKVQHILFMWHANMR